MYKVYTTNKFRKEFKKLDRSVQKLIKHWIEKNLINTNEPRIHGKALKASLKGYWRYRINNYRLIVEIDDDRLIIFALDIGHRREIYK